ncbi:MAG TPA: tripartite tricarboxylate transporter substrate-binding protein [Candidatus Acidoferrales bacterium]|nr:tripartite tricarboxylate transporter substrate-binding protein [Candidatus Acidoferrales bacterium]
MALMTFARSYTVSLAAIIGWLAALGAAAVHAQEPFFKGKTIRLIVGFTPGGLYDGYARIFSRFMPKHIPGNPEIIVQNMPGAGSLVASNYVYGVAKPDGLTLGMVSRGVYLDQLLGKKEVNYDVRRFVWIGSVDQTDLMLFVRADSPWKSIDDIGTTAEPPKCGATGTADNTTIVANVLEETLGVKLKVVRGYPGASEIDVAIAKGELHCRGTGITTHFSREPNLTWHKEGFDRHLVQTGAKRDHRLPDTPTLHELMEKKKTPEISRAVARVLLLSGTLGRPMLATPGIPADRVRILREAYLKALKEPEVIAEAKQRRLDLDVLTGEELEASMRDVINQPREVIERVKKLAEANP